MDKTNPRLLQYLGVSVALLLGFAWLRDSLWQGSTELHTLMEVVATALALNVGVLALIRFYTRKNNTFLFLGSGFLGTGFLDFYHTVVTSTFFHDLFPSPPPSLIPWSWVASRLFLALLMYFSFLAWRREDRLGEAGAIPERMVYLGITVLTLSSFVFFVFVPLPRAYYPEIPFHRPEEFVPALFFLLALIGYLRKGEWRVSSFEHWVVLSLVVGVVSQAVFMSFSGRLFDSMFDLAHLLKMVSYVCVLTGLLVNMYLLFYRAESSAGEIQGREKRIRAILDNVTDAIITIGDSGVIETVNAAVEKIFGYSAKEVVGKNISMLMPEPDRSSHGTYVLDYFSKVIGISRELQGQRKDGSVFPMELAVGEFNLGSRRMFTGICRDITERKKLEENLQENQRLLQTVFDSIPHWVMVKDRESNYLMVNKAFAESYGKTPAEFRNLSPYNLGLPKEEVEVFLEADRKVIETGKRVEQPGLEITYPDGRKTIQHAIRLPLFDNSHRVSGIVINVEDITERMEVERMKSEFISTVSHELRTPLASIVGYADLLVDGDAGELNETQREFLEIMSKNALRLTDLVGDLLDIEKLEGCRVALSSEPLDLHEVLLITHMTFKVVAEEKGLQLQVNGPQGLIVNGDKDRLVQVFSNLASNAIKYTREGSVEISAVKAGDAIQVTVRDTGIGMDAQVVKKLFSKFFRAGDAYTQAAGGTGLGLAIAKAIVIQHGGTLEVTSKPGEGSVFTVSLPSMEIGQAQQSDLETPPMENRAAPMVLCVMEDAHLLQTLEQHLRAVGISCLTAGNGEDCLHIARREKPALITLDAILGDIEGWEVIKRLKADPETEKIPIVLTSLIGEEEALRIGASAVVPKPVNEKILLGILLRLLNHSGERVLIVDDDRDFADVLQRTLRKQGLESDICFSGADALKACKEKSYDAIVLDYKMPAMSGLEVLKRLKLESRGDLHVIFISGSTIDKSIEQEALTLGSEIFLNKKIGIAEIAQAIQDRLKQVEKK